MLNRMKYHITLKNPVFSLKNLGWAEMLVALMPILGAYYLGPVPFSFWIATILIIVSLLMGKKKNRRRAWSIMLPLFIFMAYYIIHELVLYLVADSVNLNNRIEKIVFMLCIIFAVPFLDLKKLTASLNLVSLICILGLLYQMIILWGNGYVRPLSIPGLQMSQNRFETLSERPSSFFMEPAAYAFYMYVPMALSLLNKKYWWTGVLIVTTLMTTSTTGLFASFIILASYMITQGLFKGRNIVILLFATALLFAFENLSIFNTGLNKLENTDWETNVRIQQGPRIVATMNVGEFPFGAPYDGAYNYVMDGRIPGGEVEFYGEAVFMSTFWQMILTLGVVGLVLYLLVFLSIAKKNKHTIPLVVCLIVIMFTGTMYLGVNFCYSCIILYVLAIQYRPIKMIRHESNPYKQRTR